LVRRRSTRWTNHFNNLQIPLAEGRSFFYRFPLRPRVFSRYHRKERCGWLGRKDILWGKKNLRRKASPERKKKGLLSVNLKDTVHSRKNTFQLKISGEKTWGGGLCSDKKRGGKDLPLVVTNVSSTTERWTQAVLARKSVVSRWVLYTKKESPRPRKKGKKEVLHALSGHDRPRNEAKKKSPGVKCEE